MNTRRTITPSGTRTLTITVEEHSESSSEQQQPETLILRLNRKKKVSWKEGTVDNEFMGRKSSKKCCIFHKEKPFDEDFSDDESDRPNDKPHGHGHGEEGCCSHSHGEMNIDIQLSAEDGIVNSLAFVWELLRKSFNVANGDVLRNGADGLSVELNLEILGLEMSGCVYSTCQV
ncbi:hypothetical protein V2J09_013904 [Rumex salicifolius]